MCNFDCFNCKYVDCKVDADVVFLYEKIKPKYGEKMAKLIVEKYVELKEEKYGKKRSG